jgi:hypothetical protein
MRFHFVPLLLIAAVMPVYLTAQTPDSGSARNGDSAKYVGVWRGEFDNLPGVDLVVTEEGGNFHGAILFYLHRRLQANSPYTATPGLPEPMLDPALQGDTLYFQVSHRRAHPPGSLHDPPVKFHLKPTGPNQAVLQNEDEGAPVVLTKRSDY